MRKCRKRPIVWQKRPIMWQKSPIDISILEVCIRVNEAYYSCKSDLVLWQKRPSKGKRGLLFTHTTHTHSLSLSYLPSLAPPFSLRSRKHQRYRGSSQPRARQRGLEEGGGRGEGGGQEEEEQRLQVSGVVVSRLDLARRVCVCVCVRALSLPLMWLYVAFLYVSCPSPSPSPILSFPPVPPVSN